MKTITGHLVATGYKFAIISTRFNDFINEHLLKGAVDTLLRHGADENCITTFTVPGVFEIPLVAKKLAQSKKYDAIIALGCVIRGDTTHYDYVCNEASNGIASVALNCEIPVIFGVLTVESVEQAINRAGVKLGNKGSESALNAIEMVNLLQKIE